MIPSSGWILQSHRVIFIWIKTNIEKASIIDKNNLKNPLKYSKHKNRGQSLNGLSKDKVKAMHTVVYF